LCYHLIHSNFVGIRHLSDLLCGYSSPEYVKTMEKYKVYCRMSFGSPSETFLLMVFSFNQAKNNAFNTACCSVLRAILIVIYREILQKSNSNKIESFYLLVYGKFLCKQHKYKEFMSLLPLPMKANGENDASILIEILIHIFCIVFSKVWNGFVITIAAVKVRELIMPHGTQLSLPNMI